MENKQLITLAYELAKTKYKDKAFTFEKLWNDLVKKARLDAEERKVAGHVYTCMLQDRRFIFIGNHEWKIREFLKLDEQELLSHKLYDFSKEVEAAKKIADINDKEMFDQEAFYTEEQLEAMYKENKEKLMHDVDDDAEDDDSRNESNDEQDEEDAE